MTSKLKQQLAQVFGDRLKFNEPLSKHCTFKIGGTADCFLEPQTPEELIKAFRCVKECEVPYFILGGGANVLLPDEGVRGLVIKPKNRELRIEGNRVYAGSGVVLAKLANETAKAGLTGLEWTIAVPGTVGGAIRGNAGAFGGEIKDTLVSARVFDGERVKEISNGELDFSYRSSRVKKNGGMEIILDAVFELRAEAPEAALKRVKTMLRKKLSDQPMGQLCAGCLFKNIELVPGQKTLSPASKGEPTEKFFADIEAGHPDFIEKGIVPAGWIIEQLGYKERAPYKGIQVSEKHGNFLVNTGDGSAEAVKELAEQIKQDARDLYGIEMEEEVQFV